MRLRAVLFDAGNTLLHLDHPRLAAAVGPAVGVALTPEALTAAAREAARQLETGTLTDRERATRYLRALFTRAGVPDAAWPTVADVLMRLHLERHLWGTTVPGTHEALGTLRARGVRVGVVSNSDGRVEQALVAAGLRAQVEVVVDSAHVGVEKPDPAIFSPALAALDAAPAETLYVGDLYEVDVVGARRAGLDVVLVDPLGLHEGRVDVTRAPDVPAAVAALVTAGRV